MFYAVLCMSMYNETIEVYDFFIQNVILDNCNNLCELYEALEYLQHMNFNLCAPRINRDITKQTILPSCNDSE